MDGDDGLSVCVSARCFTTAEDFAATAFPNAAAADITITIDGAYVARGVLRLVQAGR